MKNGLTILQEAIEQSDMVFYRGAIPYRPRPGLDTWEGPDGIDSIRFSEFSRVEMIPRGISPES